MTLDVFAPGSNAGYEGSYWALDDELQEILNSTDFESRARLNNDSLLRDVYIWRDERLKKNFRTDQVLEDLYWRPKLAGDSQFAQINHNHLKDSIYAKLITEDKDNLPLVALVAPVLNKAYYRSDGSFARHRLGYIALDLDKTPEGLPEAEFWKKVKSIFSDHSLIITSPSQKLKVLFPIVLTRNTPYNDKIMKEVLEHILQEVLLTVEDKDLYTKWFLDGDLVDHRWAALCRCFLTSKSLRTLHSKANLTPFIVCNDPKVELRWPKQEEKPVVRRPNFAFDKIIGVEKDEFYYLNVGSLVTSKRKDSAIEGLTTILRYLADTSNGFLHGYDLSQKHLATWSGKNLEYVHRYIKQLEALGLIVCLNPKYQAGKKAKTYSVAGKLARVFRYFDFRYGSETKNFQHTQYSTINLSIELERLRYLLLQIPEDLNKKYKKEIDTHLNNLEDTISSLEVVRLKDPLVELPNAETLRTHLIKWVSEILGVDVPSPVQPIEKPKTHRSHPPAGKKALEFVASNKLELVNLKQLKKLPLKDLCFLNKHKHHFTPQEQTTVKKAFFTHQDYVPKAKQIENWKNRAPRDAKPLASPSFHSPTPKHTDSPLHQLDAFAFHTVTCSIDDELTPRLTQKHYGELALALGRLQKMVWEPLPTAVVEAVEEQFGILADLRNPDRVCNLLGIHCLDKENNIGNKGVRFEIYQEGLYKGLPKRLYDGQWDAALWYAALRCTTEQKFMGWLHSLEDLDKKKDRIPHAITTWKHRISYNGV